MAQKKLIPELRFPEFDGEWETKSLGDIGQLKNGVNKSKSDFGHGYPFVNLMDVFGKKVLRSNSGLSLVNLNQSELELYNLRVGDVLFIRSSVKRSGVGETVIVTNDLPNTVFSGFLIRFSDDGYISTAFKQYCFWTSNFRKDVIRFSSTSANTNINQESLQSLNIFLPETPEQRKIADFLSSIDKSIEQVSAQVESSKIFKKGLLQKMFV
jgi:type I restriction enzyme, S subunit